MSEDCFLNYMTTDEKPYENVENLIVRRLQRKINTLKNREHSHRKYVRLLIKVIKARDREIRELKRSQITIKIDSKPKFIKRYYGSAISRRIMLILANEKKKEE